MVRVVYTHDIFSRQATGGISRYFAELIRGIAGTADAGIVSAGRHWNRHLAEIASADVRGRSIARPAGKVLASTVRISNRVRQEFVVPSGADVVVHHTYYGFAPPARRGRLVVTVHDMIPELFGAASGSRLGSAAILLAKRVSCRLADRVISVSETTKRDLCERYGLAEDRVDVIPHGNALAHLAGRSYERPQERPYLLYVGNRSGYKNWAVLIEAIAGAAALRSSCDLVCFGGGPFRMPELELIERRRLSGRVRFVTGSDETLAAYYRHATAYVCPSLYEGFGLPCIEAMGFGCPVVCSDRGSLPEVVGPAGVYFDPTDVDPTREAVGRVALGSAAANLRPLMAEREKRYRWSRTVDATLATYRRAVGREADTQSVEVTKAA